MAVALRVLFHVPVVGWLVRDAIHGPPDAKLYFAANLVLSFVLLLYQFGYPFLICFALIAASLALVSLVVLTATDLLETNSRASRAMQQVVDVTTTLTVEISGQSETPAMHL